MNILQFFRRQNEQPAQHPSNEDRSSMAELVRLLEAHLPKEAQLPKQEQR